MSNLYVLTSDGTIECGNCCQHLYVDDVKELDAVIVDLQSGKRLANGLAWPLNLRAVRTIVQATLGKKAVL